MKITVIGAGAIGGYVGVKLALAGGDGTFIVRGSNREEIQTHGMKLVMHDGSELVAKDVKASADYAAVGPQDLVILAMKAHQVENVAKDVPQLFGPHTAVVPMQNGIPYWYFHDYAGDLRGHRIDSVDPNGVIGANIPPERVVGCVVYPASGLLAPGVVKHIEGERFPVGEPNGSCRPRVIRISERFIK